MLSKVIDDRLRNFIEYIKYGVAVVQFRADDGAHDSVRCILVNEWRDVSQSCHVVIASGASANNTIDVLVERQVAVLGYSEYS